MNRTVRCCTRLRGDIKVPGDKSISHRSLMFNGIASGQARIRGLLNSEDVASTQRCLKALGVRFVTEGLDVRVHGRSGSLVQPQSALDCGNSGTTMRLLTGIIAGQSFDAELIGDESLSSRPMSRVVDPLRLMGARIEGQQDGKYAPLMICGRRLTNQAFCSPVASAQVKSALLLAGIAGQGTQRVKEPHLSRDHTERMFAAMGCSIDTDPCSGELSMLGGQKLHCIDTEIPGDVSSAAFFMVAATVLEGSQLRLRDVGLNPTRTGIIDVLVQMGADLKIESPRVVCGEPIGDIVVRSAPLRGVKISGEIIPRIIDELPVLAVAASVAEGITTVSDAAELRVKESDRISLTCEMLTAFGAKVEERPDGFTVEGVNSLVGGTVTSGGDHRIAMSGAVAGLLARGETTVVGAECMNVSFPGFIECLGELREGP